MAVKQWATNKQGFTIVELLIVIVVIGVLAAITVVAFNGVQDSARAASAQTASAQAAKQLSLYALENGDSFPSSLGEVGIADDDNVTYQYSMTSSPPSFCVTATNGDQSFFQNNTTQVNPAAGGCPGHGQGGQPAITNLATNPSYESDNNGVSAVNASISRQTPGAYNGSFYVRATRLNATSVYGPWFNGAPVTAGNTYTASVAVRSNVARNHILRFEWINVSTSSIVSSINTQSFTSSSSWQVVTGTGTAPAGATLLRLTLYTADSGATTDYLDFDATIITAGSTVYLFADGNSPNWIWNGIANNSSSTGPQL